jgi:ATP-dependent DNA helicase RecQ
MAATAAQVFGELEASGERAELEKRFILASGGSVALVAPGETASKRSTYDETLELLQEGKTLETIAKERSLTAGTIVTHLEKLVAAGQLPIDDVRAASPAHILDGLEAIEAAFAKTTKKALTPAWKKLKGKYSYDDLKLARILLSE